MKSRGLHNQINLPCSVFFCHFKFSAASERLYTVKRAHLDDSLTFLIYISDSNQTKNNFFMCPINTLSAITGVARDRILYFRIMLLPLKKHAFLLLSLDLLPLGPLITDNASIIYFFLYGTSLILATLCFFSYFRD